MQVYPKLLDFVGHVAPTWRVTQRRNLALLAAGILTRKSLCLAELARSLPGASQRQSSRVNRLWRFLENPRLDHHALFRRLTLLSYSVSKTPGLRLPILVDITHFHPYCVLSAAVPRGGRALPIVWRTFHQALEGATELSQNQIEEHLLATCLELLAPAIQPVIIADSGFGRASLFQWLHARRADFVIRVDGQVCVEHPTYTGLLGNLPLRPGQRRWLPGLWYRADAVVQVHLLAVWERGQREPWFLVSSLADPRLVEQLYRKRMKTEHSYRHWKHHLRLKGAPRIGVLDAQRAGRLIDGVILAYWFVCLTGLYALPRDAQQRVTSFGRASFFRLALECFAPELPDPPPTLSRMLRWVASKLDFYRPPPSRSKRRYLAYRVLQSE